MVTICPVSLGKEIQSGRNLERKKAGAAFAVCNLQQTGVAAEYDGQPFGCSEGAACVGKEACGGF